MTGGMPVDIEDRPHEGQNFEGRQGLWEACSGTNLAGVLDRRVLSSVQVEGELSLVAPEATAARHRPRPPRSWAVCLAVLTASAQRSASVGRAAGSWAATA